MSNHTILLLQKTKQQSTRTYYDFPTEAEAMDHIAGLYEAQLARENPNTPQVQYRAEDLFRFMDTYTEFVGLVFDQTTYTYQPRDKEWIKDRLIAHFSGQQTDPEPQEYQPQPQRQRQRQQQQQQQSRRFNSRNANNRRY